MKFNAEGMQISYIDRIEVIVDRSKLMKRSDDTLDDRACSINAPKMEMSG